MKGRDSSISNCTPIPRKMEQRAIEGVDPFFPTNEIFMKGKVL